MWKHERTVNSIPRDMIEFSRKRKDSRIKRLKNILIQPIIATRTAWFPYLLMSIYLSIIKNMTYDDRERNIIDINADTYTVTLIGILKKSRTQ
jgi:hypothetical protein